MAVGIQDERGFSQVFRPSGTTPLRQRRRAQWLAMQTQRLGASSVIEFGCGLGDMAAAVARETTANVLAVDLSQQFIATAQQRHRLPNLTFRALDILDPAVLPEQSADAVIGNGILHHLIPNLPAVLTRLSRVVRPGGGIAFIEPNLRHPLCRLIFQTPIGRRLAKLEPQEMPFLAEGMVGLLANAGWQDISVVPRDILLPGIPSVLTRPVLAVEGALERGKLASYVAQSLFITARTVSATRASDVMAGR